MSKKLTYEELQQKIAELENKLLDSNKNFEKTNEEYISFFKNCNQIKLIIDSENGIILNANTKASEFYGYPTEVLIGMNINKINILPKEKIQDKFKIINNNNNEDNFFIFKHKLANGEVKMVQIVATPIKIDGKKIIQSVITDVSQTIEQQNKILKLESDYKTLFENINEIYFKINKNNKIELISPSAYKLLDYEKDIISENLDFYNFHQNNKDRDTYLEILKKEGEVENYILNLKSKKGKIITVSINSKVIFDKEGNFNGIVGVFSDVTIREERKRKFKKITTHLKQSQEIAKLGHWFIDFKKHTETWSDEIYHILEIQTNTEITPKTFGQFIHPDDKKIEQDNWEKALKTGNYNLNYRIVINNQIKWVNVNADIIFDKNHQPIECFGITQDITNKINTEVALSDSENKYKTIVNSTIDVIFSCDMFGRILYTNEQHEKLFGRILEEVKGKLFSKYVPLIEVPKLLKELKNIFQNKEIKDLQTVIYHKNGEKIPVEINGRIIKQDGKFVAFGSIRDIRERVKNKKELEANKKKYEHLFEQTTIPTILHNGTKIIEINNATLKFAEANSREELIGKSPLSFVHPDFHKVVIERITKVINEKNYKSTSIKEKLLTLKGNIRYSETTSNIFEVDNKKLVLVTFNDITYKIKAEKKLIESEKRYRNLFENSTIPTIVHIEGKIVMANKAICKFSECKTKNNLIGKEIKKFIHPNYLEYNETKMKKMLRRQKSFFIEGIKLLTVNKATKTANISGFVFKLHGKIAVQISFYDTTEIIEIQKKLEIATQEANEANKLKSEFLANMSHEIRTPMNAILGFSEILKSKFDENSQYKMFVDSIYSSGKNLLNLINDILDLSKIEAGRLEPQFEEIDFPALISDIQQIFSLEIQSKGLDFKINIDKNIPQFLMLDYTRLNQIFFNLVGNASKFTEEGSISIKIDFQNETANYIDLIIRIIDTGIGIPENQISHIFDSFKQVDGQSTRKYGGTGLGLAIVKRLVEIMNGTISVTSQKDIGSTFTIVLKKIEKGISNFQKREEAFNFKDINFKKSKILIVEDIESNRDILNAYLEDYNVEIQEAVNGKDALEKLEKFKPKLILMDIQMPEMNGYEATKIIKEKFKDIKVIALSAFAMNEQIEKYKDIFDDYMTKPISEHDLIKILNKYLNKEQNSDEINEDLKSKIATELRPYYENVKNNLSLDETLELSKKLINFGQNFGVELFVKQGTKLQKATKNFQLEKMETILEQLKNIIK